MSTPRSLAELQGFLADVVREPAPLRERADLGAEADRIASSNAQGRASWDCLEVYREQYWLRHVASLTEDFPTVIALIGGPPAFEGLARAYLTAFPPRTWDLQRLGAHVRDFVRDHGPWRDDPAIVDGARLDWAFMEAFDAADVAPFDASAVAAIPEDAWPGARLTFHPSLQRLTLRYPLHELRDAIRRGDDATARPMARATYVAVYRDAACFLPAVELEPAAHALLEALGAGTALGAACEACAQAAATDPADVAAKLGGWFQDWTARGWVARIAFAA